jgi:hypothetical protein
MLVACILAIGQKINIDVIVSCNTTKICSCEQWRKGPIIAKSEATSQRLRVWQALLTSLFLGKNFETILISVEKVQKEKKRVR